MHLQHAHTPVLIWLLLAPILVLLSCSTGTEDPQEEDCTSMRLQEAYGKTALRPESSICISLIGDLVFRTSAICPGGAYYITDGNQTPLYLRGRAPDAALFPRDTALFERVVVTGDFFPAEEPCEEARCDCQRGLTVRDLYSAQ